MNPENHEYMNHEEMMAVFKPYIHRTYEASHPIVKKQLSKDAFRWQAARCQTAIKRILKGWRRESRMVQEQYEETWEAMEWIQLLPECAREYLMQWGTQYFLGSVYGIMRVHLALLEKIIAQYRPSRVLEVGCGRGLNLILLASRFPEISFTGLELTKSGVKWGKQVDEMVDLPGELVRYSPFELASPRVAGRVDFVQGSAEEIPFPSWDFDLVITRQALEQMEPIRPQVFSEIHRVCSGYGVFFEAFRDWNRSGTCRNRILALDYFAAWISDLEGHGFSPVCCMNDVPVKTYMAVGMVHAKII